MNKIPAPAFGRPTEDNQGGGSSSRLKLWELDSGSHCSIIGTCLDLHDMRRIIRKADLSIGADAHDYDIHGYFVTKASTRSPLSKLIHKALDRKYAKQLAHFRRCRSAEELWELWRQGVASGDVPGTYWALMTQKAAPRAMCIRAYNEVHMLSHLMGKSSRDDIKRVRLLENTCADLSERLVKAQARSQGVLQERDVHIRSLQAQLARASMGSSISTSIIPKPAENTRERRLDKLRARLATLEQRLKAERARARAAESRLERSLESTRRMPPEELLGQLPRGALPLDDGIGESPISGPKGGGADLQGRALLYVGGYANMMPHLRAHVEQMKGTLLYHDGGIELQTGKLPGLVSQADVVVCPVACVSHAACLRLKQLCRRHGKRFVLLRSAGQSSFVSALSGIARDLPISPVEPAQSNSLDDPQDQVPRNGCKIRG